MSIFWFSIAVHLCFNSDIWLSARCNILYPSYYTQTVFPFSIFPLLCLSLFSILTPISHHPIRNSYPPTRHPLDTHSKPTQVPAHQTPSLLPPLLFLLFTKPKQTHTFLLPCFRSAKSPSTGPAHSSESYTHHQRRSCFSFPVPRRSFSSAISQVTGITCQTSCEDGRDLPYSKVQQFMYLYAYNLYFGSKRYVVYLKFLQCSSHDYGPLMESKFTLNYN